MKNTVRIKESDLIGLISRIVKESASYEGPETPEFPPEGYEKELMAAMEKNQGEDNKKEEELQQLAEYFKKRLSRNKRK